MKIRQLVSRKCHVQMLIFATQEVIRKYMSEGSVVHMCLYDLSKAFDSVEYPVLLKRLFDVGINGKLWRLLKDWYKGAACVVRSNGRLSERCQARFGVITDFIFDRDA